MKPCVEAGCPEYALDGKSRCADHHRAFERQRWERGATGRRGTRAGWRPLRSRVWQEQKKRCGDCGKFSSVFELHHIDGDATNNARTNLVALCPLCHRKADEKNRLERRRNRG